MDNIKIIAKNEIEKLMQTVCNCNQNQGMEFEIKKNARC